MKWKPKWYHWLALPLAPLGILIYLWQTRNTKVDEL